MNYYKLFIVSLVVLACGNNKEESVVEKKQAAASGLQFVSFVEEAVRVNKLHSGDLEITLPFVVEGGYHIQSNDSTKTPYLFTTFTTTAPGLISQDFRFDPHKLSFEDGELFEVISDSFSIRLHLQKEETNGSLTGELFYQTCDAMKCYFPRTLAVHFNTD